MTSATTQLPNAYVSMMAKEGHHNVPAFMYALEALFDGIDWGGKSVLEIGSGRGLMALYMGMQGPARVVSMEPEMVGATSGVIADQRKRVEALGATNVEVLAADFNTWEPAGAQFDVILSKASINHLYESAKNAAHDAETYRTYLGVVKKIYDVTAPGGVFVATDACRYALFLWLARVGIRRPWRPKKTGVDWHYHQNPGTWKKVLLDAGFSRVSIDYPVPYALRGAAPLLNSAPANFLLNGTFILRAYR